MDKRAGNKAARNKEQGTKNIKNQWTGDQVSKEPRNHRTNEIKNQGKRKQFKEIKEIRK